MPNITPNSKVNFKRGSQDSLNTLINGSGDRFTEGTFYLTTDSNRLYFAQTATDLVNLNQYIHFYSNNNNQVPTEATTGNKITTGDFYYWEQKNALMICTDALQGTWTQINPDTYLNADNAALTVTDGTTAGSKKITMTVTDSINNVATGEITLVPGSDDLVITSSGNVITLTSANDNDNTTYAISTEQTVGGNNSGTIVLTPTLYDKTHPSGVAQPAQRINLIGDGNVSISSDASGNVTINSSGGVDDVNQSFDSNGNLNTTLVLSVGGAQTPNSVLPKITYGATNQVEAKFIATDQYGLTGVAALDVYTKSEVSNLIDTKFAGTDALQYKGTVSNTDASTKLRATADAGEVFKASEDIDATVDGTRIQAKAGDLLISAGSDGNVTWEVVPSGDDQLIMLDVPSNDKTFNFIDNNIPMGGFSITEGNGPLSVDATYNNSNGEFKAYTISHTAPTGGSATTIANVIAALNGTNIVAGATELLPASNSLGSSLDIPVITSLSTDPYGHVTSATGQMYRVWDTHGTLESTNFSVDVTTPASTNRTVAKISLTSVFDGAATTSNDLTITTEQDSLRFSANGTEGLKLDLVWGSF